MWSAIATCKKQERSFFSFLLESITAKLDGQAQASLLLELVNEYLLGARVGGCANTRDLQFVALLASWPSFHTVAGLSVAVIPVDYSTRNKRARRARRLSVFSQPLRVTKPDKPAPNLFFSNGRERCSGDEVDRKVGFG